MKQELKTVGGRVKLKANVLDKVHEWAKELTSRTPEALETLRDEGVYIETVFLEKAVDGDYLIYVMKVRDMEKAGNIAKKSKHAIDAYHQAFKKECWESGEALTLLIDFDRYSELFKDSE